MAHFLDDTIDDLLSVSVTLNNQLQTIGNQIYQGGVSLQAGDQNAAGAYLKQAGAGLMDFRLPLVQLSNSFLQETRSGFKLIRSNWPSGVEEYELTWQKICEAWVKDDFEGRFWTIGIIDRMRQILWDEPFDLTWAARPEATKP